MVIERIKDGMSTPKHIVIIRLSALGDVAMVVPVLRVVSQTYPQLKLTVVSRNQYKPLFDDILNVNFLEADVYGRHKGLLGLLKLSKEIKTLGVDAVADLHSVIRSRILSLFLSLKGIKAKTLDKGRKEKKGLTNAQGGTLKKLKSTHIRYAEVFEKLGLPIDLKTHHFPERKQMNTRLHTLVGREPRKCIGIAPFAAYQSKMYPWPLITEVIAQLDATKKFRILLFGGGKTEIKRLKEMEIPFDSVSNIAGALTFSEELDLISNLDLMISMDSSNGHLAAMLGVPVITLWGVTHPYAGFVPFGQPNSHQLISDRNKYPLIPTSVYGNKFPEGYENCMESIPPSLVVEKVGEVI